MSIVKITVASREDVNRRVMAAFSGEPQGSHISFASVDLLWKTLVPKRFDLMRAMIGEGSMTIRAVARGVGRDVKAVHGDVHALLKAGILDRTEDGKVIFPYDAIHVDFTITKAA